MITIETFTFNGADFNEFLYAILKNYEMSDKSEEEVIKDLNYYISKIAKKSDYLEDSWLSKLYQFYPAAAVYVLLREIAIELDLKYDDHIKDSPEIYVVSMSDGRIHKANKHHIKNYHNFAAFRTIDDAKEACGVVRELLKVMFKDEVRK